MPPILTELLVVEPAEYVRMVVQPVRGAPHLIEVLAAVPGGRFLFGSLTDDVQFFAAQLHDHLEQATLDV